MIDIEEWGRPENLGLRRERSESRTIARRGGLVALLLGAGLWGCTAMTWTDEFAFLGALDSAQGRLGAGLLLGGGAIALLVVGLAFRHPH